MPRCDHCLLDFPDKDAMTDYIGGRTRVFCCAGCNGIYRLINNEGLEAFYRKRTWRDGGISRELLEKEIDPSPFQEHVRDTNGKKEIDIYLEGIRCASCVWLNEKILSRTDGVDFVRVNYATHRARILWDPTKIDISGILRRITSIGYLPKPYSESERFSAQRAEARDLLIRFGTAAFLSSQLMIYSIALYAGYFQGIEPRYRQLFEIIAMFLTVPIIFYAGMPFIKNTLIGLKRGHFGMDSLIAIGTVSAFLYSIYEMFSGGTVYFDTAAMIVTLILLGRYIEAHAKGKASETLERLAELTPKTATKLDASGTVREVVTVDSLRPGDMVEIKPGEKVPADGTVMSGASESDESLLTGESRPVSKNPGDTVIGGSINLYGSIVVTVTHPRENSVLAGIIRAVEDAQTKRPKIQALADRIVGIFVPLILLLAAATSAFHLLSGETIHLALMTGISVLVIACPCSLGLATPLAVLVFTSLASSRGVLIKEGDVVETAPATRAIIFDKTGTITVGASSLRDVLVLDKEIVRDYLLSLAASVEILSEHSLGKAISAGSSPVFQVTAFETVPGKGVRGVADHKRVVIGNRDFMAENAMLLQLDEKTLEATESAEKRGDTVVYMGWEAEVRGCFIVADTMRNEARAVVRKLLDSGRSVSLVSGDTAATTSSIASLAGIPEYHAGASPTDKRHIVSETQSTGVPVLMVGDGINDAPALSEASVGIAMGRGIDIAMESSRVVLVRNDLALIPFFLGLSGRTYRVIQQNIFWSFFYNIVAIPLAMTGRLHPIFAAGAMAASSLFVVFNSLRIRRILK